MQQRLYSVRQIATFAGVHANTIRNLVKRGEIKAYRLGTLIRIPHSEIRRLFPVGDDADRNADVKAVGSAA